MDTNKREKHLYQMAEQRDQAVQDVQQVGLIQDIDENVLMSNEMP